MSMSQKGLPAMIISDKYKFIIACPTKTGTNSMRALPEQWKRRGGSERVLRLLTGERRTRHRVSPPPGCEDYTRYMMWRDDNKRLISMYEYLRRKDWEWCGADIIHNERHYGRAEAWLRFLRVIAATRQADGYFRGGLRGNHGSRPYMWTDTMFELEDYLSGVDVDGSHLPWTQQSVKLISMDDLMPEWTRLLSEEDVGGEDDAMFDLTVAHRNSSPSADRLFSDASRYWRVRGACGVFHEIMGAGY